MKHPQTTGAPRARHFLGKALRLPLLGALALGLIAPAAHAVTPIPFNGTTYTENFNTLPTAAVANATTPPTPVDVPNLAGWQYRNTVTTGNSNFSAGTGSANGGGVYSFGTDASDRALGLLASGGYIGSIGVIFQNNTGGTLNSFTLSYTGEQWRSSTVTQNTLSFNYAVTPTQPTIAAANTAATALDFVGFPPVPTNGQTDGNDAANRKTITNTISGVNWGAGQYLVIRFDDVNDPGNDAGLALDDLSFAALAPAPGTVAFAATNVTVNEGDGTATLTVSRTNGGTGAISVNYAITPGTATAADYGTPTDSDGGTPGVINWADGDVADKTITIPIVDDTLTEGSESFTVNLSGPGGGATLGTPSSATVTIQDNDVAGTFAFSSATYSVGEAAGTATITVNRTIGTSGTATVDYATSNGTATAGSDYTATSGTLTFIDGVDTQTFTVPIINDTDVEGDETVNLTLSNATAGALLGTPNPATLTIQSDDAPTVLLNELKINPAGSDNGAEYVEIKGTPGMSLPTGIYFVSIEGDSGGTQGNATLVSDLGGQTLGSNGLLVITGTTSPYTFDAATTVLQDPQFNGGILQNGSNSFAVIFSPTNPITANLDLDTNDDGALDLPSGAVLTDALGYTDGGTGDQVYGGVTLALPSGGAPDGVTRFLDNNDAFSAAAFYYGDLLAGNPTDNDYDTTSVSGNFPTGGRLTPGAPNTLAAVTNTAPVVNPTINSPTVPGPNDLVITDPRGSDADGDPLTYTFVYAINGTVIAGETDKPNRVDLSKYTVAVGDTFTATFTANDGTVDSAPVTLTRTIAAPPVANPASGTAKAGVRTTIGPITGTDPNGLALRYVLLTQPTSGSAFLAGSASNVQLYYTSAPGFSGADSVTYQVVNSEGRRSAPATISITVTANSAPVASNGTATVTAGVRQEIPLTATDADGDALRYRIATAPTKGSAFLANNSSGGVSLFYTSTANATGADSVVFSVTDTSGASSTGTISITIQGNSAPTANATTLDAISGMRASVVLSGSDPDGDAIVRYRITTQPTNGSAFLAGSGNNVQLYYTSNAGYTGPDSVAFTVTDSTGRTSTPATVSIQVSPAPAAATNSGKVS